MNDKVHLIGGKTYKEAEIIIMPTNDPSHITLRGGTQLFLDKFKSGGNRGQNAHLHILSNNKIRHGDWYVNLIQIEEGVYKVYSKTSVVPDYYHYLKKIIASTDESLKLPRPSDNFIKRYCDLNGIDKVLIECAAILHPDLIDQDGYIEVIGFGKIHKDNFPLIKIAPDNTITIRPIEDSKKLFTIDEVVDFTANMISQYKFGNTNIQDKKLIRESLLSSSLKQYDDDSITS